MTYKLPPLPEPSWPFGSKYNGKDMQAYAIAAIEAQGVPDGWQLVPKEPTPEMLDAGRNACNGNMYPQDMLHGPRAMMADSWFAALASAPPAPQAEELAQWKARALQAEAIVAKFMEPQASVVQQEPTTFLVVCPDCDGTGFDKKDSNYQCEHCHGSGRVEMDLYTHPAQQAKPQPLSDEQSRELAEQHYVCSQWYGADLSTGIGSRQWCAYWDGWRAAHGITKE